jgi:hypothetical protein
MNAHSIVRWVVSVCTWFRLSQRKTLGELVFGAMRCRRVSIAEIGRSLNSRALTKHSIKRVYRFLKNTRVEAAEAARRFSTGLLKGSLLKEIHAMWSAPSWAASVSPAGSGWGSRSSHASGCRWVGAFPLQGPLPLCRDNPVVAGEPLRWDAPYGARLVLRQRVCTGVLRRAPR